MLTEMTENMLIKHLMKEFLVEGDKGSPMLYMRGTIQKYV